MFAISKCPFLVKFSCKITTVHTGLLDVSFFVPGMCDNNF